MKSITQLFDSVPSPVTKEFSDAFTLEVQAYLADLKNNFLVFKKDNDIKEAMDISLAELMPNDLENLNQLTQKIESIYEYKRAHDDLNADFETIYTAVITKEAILNKITPDLASKITNLKTLQVDELQLNMMEKTNEIIEKIKASYSVNKTKNIAAIMAMLTPLIQKSPSYIQNFPLGEGIIMDGLNYIGEAYNSHLRYASEGRDKESADRLDEAELQINKTLSGLCTALGVRSNALAQEVPVAAHAPLVHDYNALIDSANILRNFSGDINQFHIFTDDFAQKFNQLITKMDVLEHSEARNLFLQHEKNALEQSKDALPFENFPYIIDFHDLNKSQNEFIISQKTQSVNNSTLKSHDLNNFLLKGKENDLKQIMKDAKRNLTIEFEKVNAATLNDPEKFNKLLIDNFGEKNTEWLIANFDQGLSYLIAGPIAKSGSSEDLMAEDALVIKQPENIKPTENTQQLDSKDEPEEEIPAIKQNMFMKNDIVYRDAELNNLIINQEINDVNWNFKCNVKVTSYITEDGFAVLHLATDSPLIAKALMNKSTVKDFQMIVDTVLKFEDQFTTKLAEYEKDKNGAQFLEKKQSSQEILATISSFKNGEINFDKFCEQIKTHHENAKKFTHGTISGAVGSFFTGKDPGSISRIKEFDAALDEIQKSIKTDTAKYLRPQSDAFLDVENIATRPRSHHRI